jgi:hypothetical protein
VLVWSARSPERARADPARWSGACGGGCDPSLQGRLQP